MALSHWWSSSPDCQVSLGRGQGGIVHEVVREREVVESLWDQTWMYWVEQERRMVGDCESGGRVRRVSWYAALRVSTEVLRVSAVAWSCAVCSQRLP